MLPTELLISMVLVGIGAGAASGLFGIGGGIITVPFVLFLTPLSFRESVAVSLLAIAATTPMGLWSHDRAGHVRWTTGAALGVGGVAGVLLGTALDPLLNELALLWLFAGLLVFASHRIAYGAEALLRKLHGTAALAATGVLAGAVAKLLGIGGGILIVPTLVFSGFTIHLAVATSLVAVFTNAAFSSIVNLVRFAQLDWILVALPVALGSWVGVLVGSRAALKSRADVLQRAFALLLLAVALSLIYRSLQ